MKDMYFVTADIEAPHRSYYADVDAHTRALGFGGKWAWPEDDGGPPEDALFWSTLEEAEAAAEELRGREAWKDSFGDTIEVTKITE